MASRRSAADLSLESSLGLRDGEILVGLDEVGRGAWAGPMVVGAVAIEWPPLFPPEGIADSKLLSPSRRRLMFNPIVEWSTATSTGWVSAKECDALGMTEATAVAAFRALDALGLPASVTAVVVDGVVDPFSERHELAAFGTPMIVTKAKADRTSTVVAAASIVAKVTRDDHMVDLDGSFPPFCFAANKGYPSPEHRRALLGYGLTSEHRRSWRFTHDWVIGPRR